MTTDTPVLPLTPDALVYELAAAGDPRVSPDGQRVLYALAYASTVTGRGESHLWLCDIDGGNRRRLTWSGERNGWGRWSPDGSQIAFVSDRAGDSALFVLSLAGGDAREVTRCTHAIGDVAWSPDGAHIAFTALVEPDREPLPGCASPVRVTRRRDYKQDNRGYLGEARTQVLVVEVASGDRRHLTHGDGDALHPQWSPDGARLAVSLPTAGGLHAQLGIIDAHTGDVLPVGEPEGVVSAWSWSPDGGRILVIGDTHQTFQTDLFLFTLATNELRRLTDDLPCLPDGGFATVTPPHRPVWLDRERVLFHAVEAGASGLYTVDTASGAVTRLTHGESLCSGLSVDDAGRVAVQAYAALDAAGEVLVTDLETATTRVLAIANGERVARAGITWETLTVERAGCRIEAWLLKPPGFDPARRYPLVLDVHGGPNGNYGYGFNVVQQALASAGFLVLFANPRGSTTYGRAFTQMVTRDWGGEDYRDLLAVVDAVQQRTYVDAARTGIWGYSYGGYMTAWAISQSTRFAAAVCGAPCFDLASMWGTSDFSYEFGALQWGGPPHEARDWYMAHSPATFAHQTRTPTLIVHGEADARCPIGQGEQMFMALASAGCEVEFVRYPDGSHLFLRVGPPAHRADLLRRVVDWFTRYLIDQPSSETAVR